MDAYWKDALWKQFGAAIEMFGNALIACPDKLWKAKMWKDSRLPPGFPEFWYVAYHTLFWLDLYLSGSVVDFSPPSPYTLDELEPEAILPDRVYTPEELRSYLDYCRQKCHRVIKELTDERASEQCNFLWTKKGITFAELILDNLRHVQEHGAQLNMFLGQQTSLPSHWVGDFVEN